MQIMMFLLLLVLCNMLIYSVLSIPLYRIICTTSSVSVGVFGREESLLGTVSAIYAVTYSIYFFIHTFIIDVSGACSSLAVNCFIFEILHTWEQFILQVINSIGAVEFERAIPTYLIHMSMMDGGICNTNFVSVYLTVLDCQETVFSSYATDVPYVDYVFYKLNLLVYNNNILLVDSNKIYEVFFLTRCSTKGVVEFYALQQRVFVIAGETTLVFFRVHNPTSYNISCFTVYFLYPDYLSIYFYKLQCFCFEILHMESNEILDLPVLFYISHDIAADVRFCSKFIVYYVLFPVEKIKH